MPAPIAPGDRKILIVAGVLLLLLVAAMAVVTPQRAPSRGFPSSYAAASDGAKAAFLLLRELDYHVERWEQPPTELPQESAGHLLILADPMSGGTASERQAIRNFIRNGGTVLATGRGAMLLPESDVSGLPDAPLEWQPVRASFPSPITRNADEIEMLPEAQWTARSPTHVRLYEYRDAAVAVAYRYGRGRVIWWAAATPLTNAGITRAQNLQLFLNSVGAPEEFAILWDEYFHGVERSLWSYLGATPLPWAAGQLLLVAAVIVFTFSRRLGPIRAPATETRLSPLEFVDTLGALYQRSRAASAAVGVIYQRFRYLILRRLGLAANSTAAQIHQAVRDRLHWSEPGFMETLQNAERARRSLDTSDHDALPVVQALYHYSELYRLIPRKKEPGHGSTKGKT